MEFLRLIVVYIHLIGFAVLFGAWLMEAYTKRNGINPLQHIGFTIAAVAGLALAAPWGLSYDLSYAKIGTKLVILLIIGAFLGIGQGRQRKTGSVPPWMFWSIGVLTLANAGIAVLWR